MVEQIHVQGIRPKATHCRENVSGSRRGEEFNPSVEDEFSRL
jgi:hypothetical protein